MLIRTILILERLIILATLDPKFFSMLQAPLRLFLWKFRYAVAKIPNVDCCTSFQVFVAEG